MLINKFMANKLFLAKTPDGYSLYNSTEDKDAKKYQILRAGTFFDLIHSIANLPNEFYKEGVQVIYWNENNSIEFPEKEKDAIDTLVRKTEEIEFRKFLETFKK